ncbi:hypothetical protein B0A49_10748 [Cryomyces minteri]|uniref:Uncharacterized protein n=1 Tax=Cryomyces minteri TaxID=331657 RepID=A0A4U0VKP8_9PEZI|nr:hypothetical protein B0A49_10748 [Cryomyces minteri]
MAAEQFGAASAGSMRHMYNSALKKVKDAGGLTGVAPTAAPKGGRKRKNVDGVNDVTSTPTKSALKKGKLMEEAVQDTAEDNTEASLKAQQESPTMSDQEEVSSTTLTTSPATSSATFSAREVEFLMACIKNMTNDPVINFDGVALEVSHKDATVSRAMYNRIKREKIKITAPAGGVDKSTPSKKTPTKPRKAAPAAGGENGPPTTKKRSRKPKSTAQAVEEGGVGVKNEVKASYGSEGDDDGTLLAEAPKGDEDDLKLAALLNDELAE